MFPKVMKTAKRVHNLLSYLVLNKRICEMNLGNGTGEFKVPTSIKPSVLMNSTLEL